MCASSAISDYYMDHNRWPQFPSGNPFAAMDGTTARQLKDIFDKLEKIDKRLKDIECKDPSKKKFKRALSKRIRETRKST